MKRKRKNKSNVIFIGFLVPGGGMTNTPVGTIVNSKPDMVYKVKIYAYKEN